MPICQCEGKSVGPLCSCLTGPDRAVCFSGLGLARAKACREHRDVLCFRRKQAFSDSDASAKPGYRGHTLLCWERPKEPNQSRLE